MGSEASARIEEAANASPDDLEPGLTWKRTVLDCVLIQGDYAFLGAAALGKYAMEKSVPFAEQGDKKLACIVDSGHAHLFYRKFIAVVGRSCRKDIKTWVVLLPSVDSDPRFYGASLTQAMSVALFICRTCHDSDIRFVHRDFYYENPIGCGVDWLPTFLDTDAKILPGSQRAAMLAWLETWVQTVWDSRAGVHWAVEWGDGCNLGKTCQDIVRQLLTSSKAVEDTTLYQGSSTSVLTVKVTPDGETLHVACMNMAGDTTCSKEFNATSDFGELASFLQGEFPEGSAPTFFQDAEKVSYDSKIADYTSLTAARSMVDAGLPTILNYPKPHLKFAVGDLHGFAGELGLKQFEFDEARVAKWVETEAEITFFADVSSLDADFDKTIEKLRESTRFNDCVLSLIIVAKDFGSFKCPNIAFRLCSAVENVDACVFATLDDMEKVKSVFINRPSGYPDGLVLCQAMIAFARLHFFCLLGEDGKTCGREVPDQSMMFSSVKFGLGAPTLPSSKFCGGCQFMHGPDGPLHYVTLPGDDKVTVTMPCHILVDIFSMALDAECDEGTKMEKKEARTNLMDIIREHAHYAGIDVDVDDPRGVEDSEDEEW